MDGSLSPRQFRAVVTGISPRGVPSKSLKRNEPIIRVCTARSSILAGTPIVADADADMLIPPGGKFIPAPMHYFMRFAGADGMHAGYLPGNPASHGCVRMPERYAIAFFNSVSVGTPVTVYGRTPTGRYLGQSRPTFPRGPNRFADPRFDPRFAPPPPPWWWR